MTDKLICFGTAKLAKEIEFDEPCNNGFCGDTDEHLEGPWTYKKISKFYPITKDNFYLLPTQSLLQRWLREQHGLVVYPNMIHNAKGDKEYVCFYYFTDMLRGYLVDNKGKRLRFPFYELALEDGLKSACEYVKDKQNGR